MKRLAANLFALFTLLCLQAAVPDGYYNSLIGLKDKALKDAVHTLAANHTKLSYDNMFKYYRDTDPWPSDPTKIWDMYTNSGTASFLSNNNCPSGMSREHSVPKSWWGGDNNYAYNDLIHLVPVNADANSARSNWPFGDVATIDWDNGVSKRGTPSSGQGGGASKVFEPDDQYKGDFARIYFYMACCYQDLNWVIGGDNTMFDRYATNWKTLNAWSVELLLRWAREDPVSDKEINRNEAVYSWQNNRNPFVDNPDLMEYIWGNKQGVEWGATEPEPPVNLFGDFNNDGVVDVSDLNILVNIILGRPVVIEN